jgi:hypothetical protein
LSSSLFSGRPQLLAGQAARLAPRQLGPQVALQVAGQQSVAGATIMPFFRPAMSGKPITVATTQGVGSVALTSQNQTQQQQLFNQVWLPSSMSLLLAGKFFLCVSCNSF